METLVGWDRSLFLFLNGLHASWLDPLMGWISGTWTWLPLYGVLLFLVWKEGGWRRLVAYLVCVGLVVLLADRISVVAFKDVVRTLWVCLVACRECVGRGTVESPLVAERVGDVVALSVGNASVL